MKDKIYAIVVKYHDDDIEPEIIKCFTNYEMAQKYKEELEEEDKVEFWMVKKCRECNKNNRECPFYIEPTWLGMGCENKKLFYILKDFNIVETELDDGKKN